jgi:putative transposase
MRTLKEECVWLQNFTSLEDARARIGDFIDYYNTRRFHQALNYNTPKQQHTILTRDDKQLV